MKQPVFLLTAFALLFCGCGGGNRVKSPVPVTPAAFTLTAKNLTNIAWIGDSYATGGNITGPFTSALQAQYGNAGIGWLQLYYLNSNNLGATFTIEGHWNVERNTPVSSGLNLSNISSSDGTGSFVITATASKYTLYYLNQPGGGAFQYWADNGTPMTVSTAAASKSIGSVVIDSLGAGTHALNVQCLTASVTISGVDARSAAGVVVHNLGSAGSDSANWTGVDATLWQSQLTALQPTLVIVMLTPNDAIGGITVDQQAVNLTALVSRIRAAMPNVPIILAPSPDNGLNLSPSMAAYNTSQAALAKSLGLGYIDVFDAMGTFNPADFNSDLLHPNAEGGALIAKAVLSGITNYMR